MAARKDVFTIRESEKEGEKGWWIKIGSCWECKDGSWNVFLDALPVNGKLNIRDPLPPKDGSRTPQEEPF